MDFLKNDLLAAFRALRRQPAFALIVFITLTLGISANTTMFSVVRHVLLKPLAYAETDRLAIIWETNASLGISEDGTSFPNYRDWREASSAFEDMGVFQLMPYNLSGNGPPERIWGVRVTPNLFPILGVEPERGRMIRPEEVEEGGQVAIVSHGFWQRRTGMDSDLIGKSVHLSGQSYTIVGIMPAGFEFPPPIRFGDRSLMMPIEVWVPIVPGAAEEDRKFRLYCALGRMAPGIDESTAQKEMELIAERLSTTYPNENGGWSASVVSLHDQVVAHLRPSMLILMGAVGFVLLLICANLANLFLARAAARSPEWALRMTLGASPGRVVSRILTESLLITLLGGIGGLVASYWFFQALIVLGPGTIPRLETVSIDSVVLAFTFATAAVTALLFGLVPALRASRVNMCQQLVSGGRAMTGDRQLRRLRASLIVFEVALALALSISLGLCLKSFLNLTSTDLGFESREVVAAEMLLSPETYQDAHRVIEFQQKLIDRLTALPGVEVAGLVNMLPLSEYNMEIGLEFENRLATRPEDHPTVDYRAISPGYLDAMGIEVVAGRGFRESDDRDAPRVALINQSLAKRYSPTENPIGQRLLSQEIAAVTRGLQPSGPKHAYEIVGIVGDVKHFGPASGVLPEVYVPLRQDPWPLFFAVVRTPTAVDKTTDMVRLAIWDIDQTQAIADVTALEERLNGALAMHRFTLLLLVAFGILAACLAALGTYGIVTYLVSQRTLEFGIRLAMGSSKWGLVRFMFREMGLVVLAGVALGLVVAFGSTRFMESMLYEVSTTDLETFVWAALSIFVIGCLAAFVPTLRVSRIDPAVILRESP